VAAAAAAAPRQAAVVRSVIIIIMAAAGTPHAMRTPRRARRRGGGRRCARRRCAPRRCCARRTGRGAYKRRPFIHVVVVARAAAPRPVVAPLIPRSTYIMSVLRARFVMYALTTGFTYINYVTWYGLITNGWIAFAARALDYNAAEIAMLMGSFAIGYVPVQIPGALISRVVGEHLMISANLAVQAAGCFAIPTVARWGAVPLSVCLGVMGLFQGCRVFANEAIDARWMPDGLERIWVSQMRSWIGQVCIAANMWLVPRLAGTRGWKAVPRLYGVLSAVMLVLWHGLAADRPSQWRGAGIVKLLPDERDLLAHIGTEKPAAAAAEPAAAAPTAVPDAERPALTISQLLSIPRVRGIFSVYVLEAICARPFGPFDPIYFMDRYGLTAVETGVRLAALNIVTTCSGLLVSSVESVLIRLRWKTLDIRRRCQTAAYVLEAAMLLLYAHMPTASGAIAVRVAMTVPGGLQGMGLHLCVREMGREDAGVFGAITNSTSRADGFLTPLLVTAIRARFGGSWLPCFYWAAVIQILSSVVYFRCASVRSARQLLAERDAHYDQARHSIM
jgi:hypothetical protein